MGVTPRGQLVSLKYTANGSAKLLDLPHGADYVMVKNLTQWGASANPGVHVQAEWFPSLNAGEALTIQNDNSANSIELEKITADGFRYLDPDNLATSAASTVSGITAASPAVATTSAAHGLVAGDVFRLTGTTGMLQVAGMLFSVKAAPSTTTLSMFLDASGFAAAATAGSLQKIQDKRFLPAYRYITGITKAANAVVTMSVAHQYSVGQQLKLRIPAGFGMVEMDGLTGNITDIDTTNNTVTLDIDSSGFTTFAFPLSGAVPFSFAMVEPYGNVLPAGNLLSGDEGILKNTAKIQMELGTAIAGAANDVMEVLVSTGDRRDLLQ